MVALLCWQTVFITFDRVAYPELRAFVPIYFYEGCSAMDYAYLLPNSPEYKQIWHHCTIFMSWPVEKQEPFTI